MNQFGLSILAVFKFYDARGVKFQYPQLHLWQNTAHTGQPRRG
jgi:hypothetical protein